VLGNLTNTLIDLINNFYAMTGLFGIALAMAIESCCIPLPSEIVMPLAGVMIANGTLLPGMNPWLALVLVGLAGAAGCLVGSIAAYGIGYAGGRPLMLKYGRYLLISQHDADKADAFFQRWGSATAFFSRLLPVVRTYISLPAGIAKMPFAKFCVYSFLGSFPWCFLLAYLGKTVIGDNLKDVEKLSPIFHSFDVVILVVLIVLVVLYVRRHIRNDRKAREAHAAGEQAQFDLSQRSTAQQPWVQIPASPSQAPWQNNQQFPPMSQQPRQPFPPSGR
jgi:membrane protein DedA with SNARE-associated domain